MTENQKQILEGNLEERR